MHDALKPCVGAWRYHRERPPEGSSILEGACVAGAMYSWLERGGGGLIFGVGSLWVHS